MRHHKKSSLDSTFLKGNKKAENTLNENLSNSDEDLVDISTDLEGQCWGKWVTFTSW